MNTPHSLFKNYLETYTFHFLHISLLNSYSSKCTLHSPFLLWQPLHLKRPILEDAQRLRLPTPSHTTCQELERSVRSSTVVVDVLLQRPPSQDVLLMRVPRPILQNTSPSQLPLPPVPLHLQLMSLRHPLPLPLRSPQQFLPVQAPQL